MECWRKRSISEKKSLVTIILVSAVLIGLITLIVLVTEPVYCYTSSCSKATEYINRLINLDAKPCDNFYDFVCGNALNHSHQSQNAAGKTENTKILKEILSEPIHVNDTKSLKLQKQFYRSCIDLKAIDADNDTTFTNLIANLGGWPVVSGNNWNESAFDFAEFMVELREKGLQHDWFLDITVYSNRGQHIILEINIPDNANKIEEEVEEAYLDLMTKTAVAFGAHDNVANQQMPEVMYFENKLANLIDEIHNENEMLYSHHPLQLITIAAVQQKWQNINWLELINHLTKKKLSDNQQVAFFAEKYMPQLHKLLEQTAKRTQVNYVMWKLVEAYSPFLSEKIRELARNFSVESNQTDLWYKDRKEFCFEESKSYFQYTLEAEFLRRQVPESKRKKVEDVVRRVVVEVESHVQEAEWMDEKMRTAAAARLKNMTYIVGGPKEMYHPEQFDKVLGGNIEFNSTNIIEIVTGIFHKSLDTLYNKKYEDTSYLKYSFFELVTSQEVKFDQDANLLWIPAGILNEFFYDDDRPNYLNYGTLGTTIAYELVRGLYAGLFRNVNLWTNSTRENFNRAVDCLKNCSLGVSDSDEVRCEGNLLENISDYICINLSYQAYQKWFRQNRFEEKLIGSSFSNNQLFWVAYGTSLCHQPVPELNYSRFNHMMQSLRVVGPFRNSLYFSKDFRCELNTNMNPRNKCQIL